MKIAMYVVALRTVPDIRSLAHTFPCAGPEDAQVTAGRGVSGPARSAAPGDAWGNEVRSNACGPRGARPVSTTETAEMRLSYALPVTKLADHLTDQPADQFAGTLGVRSWRPPV